MRRLGCRRSEASASREALQGGRSKGATAIDVRARFWEVPKEASTNVYIVRIEHSAWASGSFRRVGGQVSSRYPFTFVLGLKFRGIE